MRTHWQRIEKPDLSLDSLTLAFVRDHHLRCVNGTAEDDYIQHLMTVSLGMAQRRTRRLLITQRWKMITDGFPCDAFVIDKGPVQEVESIDYVDTDGVVQPWGASPFPYTVLNPTIETNQKATIERAYGEVWPDARCQGDAVRITMTLGYPNSLDSPSVAEIEEEINQGRLLVIGEMYKQRSESMAALHNTPALIRANSLWDAWRLY